MATTSVPGFSRAVTGEGAVAAERIYLVLAACFLFKVLVALADTPVAYLIIRGLRSRFHPGVGEALELTPQAA